MTRSIGLKVTASALAIGLAMAAWPAAQARRPHSDAAKSDRQAGSAANQAQLLAGKHKFAEALPFAEQAVAESPRDAGYRMLLADLYLRNGRYQSAATTYGDVLSLDPSNQRAALSLALCDVSEGHNAAAIAVLDSVADTAPVADVGLAYALAGQPRRGIALLEPAAHAAGAGGRVRQNLALAYALAGDWEKARATAAQDVSPADLGPRLEHWAQLAKPSGTADAVAALLGVRPAANSGQPQRLALNSGPSGTALASADVPPAPQAAPEPAPAAPAVAAAAAQPAPDSGRAATADRGRRNVFGYTGLDGRRQQCAGSGAKGAERRTSGSRAPPCRASHRRGRALPPCRPGTAATRGRPRRDR